MAKLPRRAALVAVAAVVLLFLVPAEPRPATGQWLARAGIEPRIARVGRFDVRYVRTGHGPTLVLIHGLASSIYSWSDVIPALAESFDVIALDLPGFGASSQPADLAFDDYLPTVTGLMDQLGVPRAHFAGNSMGGAVSLLMAAREPARVDRLVLLDSAGFNLKLNERPFMVRVLGSKMVGLLAERVPVRRLLTGVTLRHLMQDDSRVTGERIDEYVAPLLRPGALESARSLLHSRIDERLVTDLGMIRAKTLVVWGRFDPWLPESHADGFVAGIKDARKVVLETGHMPQEERPVEVARLIREFLVS